MRAQDAGDSALFLIIDPGPGYILVMSIIPSHPSAGKASGRALEYMKGIRNVEI